MENFEDDGLRAENSLNLDSSDQPSMAAHDEYALLQRRTFLLTLIAAASAAAISSIFFSSSTSISLLLGAFAGLCYLRLLARSIGKLGEEAKTVSKVQLIIPALLVLAVAKLPELEMLPALFGFLLYKPSLALQVMLESRT